jgi:predicted AlkP superfamily phosphohydrolase/phosphomutase
MRTPRRTGFTCDPKEQADKCQAVSFHWNILEQATFCKLIRIDIGFNIVYTEQHLAEGTYSMNYAYIDPGTGYTIASFFGWIIAGGLGFIGLLTAFRKRIFKPFRNRKYILIIIAAVIVVGATILIIGMLMGRRESDFDRKIIIIGFDGLSPHIIEPMMAGGELPHFTELAESGSYAALSTTNPSQSPVAWSGFSTGKNPGKHGVYDFIVRDPKTMELSLSLSAIKRGRAVRVKQEKSFWDYTSNANIQTIVLGCPVTFPPDRVFGKMISGMGVPDILGTEGTFTFYTTVRDEADDDTGGTVVTLRKAPLMVTHLIGPKKSSIGGNVENITVPMKIQLEENKAAVRMLIQGNSFELKPGKWSDWKSVSFDLGQKRTMRGILKFYLVEVEPELQLYASPINFDPRDPFFPLSHPKDYSHTLATEIGLFYTQGMPMDTWAVNEGRLNEEAHIEQISEVLREKKAMLDYELSLFEKGVLFCYFESSDIVQHMFWRYTDPMHPLYEENAPEEYRQLISSWYRKMDAILGEVMDHVDEEDVLFVLSDHGFDTFRRSVHLNSWLREQGYLELKDPYAVEGGELLSDIDWSKTKAYSIGFGAVYINQKGREKYGIVEKGAETEALKAEIQNSMMNWIDDKNESSVISKLYDGNEIFRGPYADSTPDLYVGFHIGYRASWQSALGAVPEETIEDNLKKWSGSHLFDPKLVPGVLFCNEEVIKKDPSIYDLTPTIVKLIGYNEKQLLKCDFDGLPLF